MKTYFSRGITDSGNNWVTGLWRFAEEREFGLKCIDENTEIKQSGVKMKASLVTAVIRMELLTSQQCFQKHG